MTVPTRIGRIARAIGALAAICCTASAVAVEANAAAVVFRGGPHDMLYAVAFEGPHGLAVGDLGLIVETGDGGASWRRAAAPPTNLALFAVARKNGRCVAAGQSGLILSADNCRDWRPAPTVADARLLSLAMNAGGVAFAVGGFGTLLRSTDWGKSWQPLKPDWKALTGSDAEPHLYDVQLADNGEVTVAGEFELVLRSRDGGANWSLLHKGTRSLFALRLGERGEIFAVGQEGLILRSEDGGGKWQAVPSGTKSILTGLWVAPDGRLVASGIYSILHSSDNGNSWRRDDSKLARLGWHQALAVGDEGKAQANVVLVGSGGTILSVKR